MRRGIITLCVMTTIVLLEQAFGLQLTLVESLMQGAIVYLVVKEVY